MNARRLVAIALIFFVAAGAWFILGASVEIRTATQDAQLRNEVGGLWGTSQVQRPPTFAATMKKRERTNRGRLVTRGLVAPGVGITASRIRADFDLDQRKKGLLWYATYKVDLGAAYTVHNPNPRPAKTRITFAFPTKDGVYDGFKVVVRNREVPVRFVAGNAVEGDFVIPASSSVTARLGYRTQGLDKWTYAPTDGIGAVKDFKLVMTTDFKDVDFPDGAVSPTSKRPTPNGWELTWAYSSLISGRTISLVMPKPLNPGPIASRISFFAPVSLLFFFAALVLGTATSRVRIHPMNYAFLAAGFFAFQLLFAYLVDRVDINVAFLLASLTSIGLCVGYLYLAIGPSPTLFEAAVSQFVFLVLFSYSFFFEGYTGLAITMGAIATLAFFMVKTGRVDWEDVFEAGAGPRLDPEPEAFGA